jgi:hypothetical protein
VSAKLQTVHVRVNDSATGQPTPCRVRFTGPDGTYYAPFGRLTEFACGQGKDVGGNLQLPNGKKYAYIDGACEISLPPGPIQVEVRKGFEYTPLTQQVDLKPGQLSLRLSIERWHDARSQGWYSGDVHVEYLTPHAALLEGAAEDVAVVNLLAKSTFFLSTDTHPHPAIPNLLAFSGQRPCLEVPGCMVVVNTLNWHQELGELILLNCHRVVYPLAFGHPAGPDDWTLADWCDQCHRKGGLVIAKAWGALAEFLSSKVDAFEVTSGEEIGDYGFDMISEFLKLGYPLTLVAGSAKCSNQRVLGEFRTYARLLPDQELTYKNWIEAVRAGRTFITNGPLLYLTVNGQGPGAVLELAKPDEKVHIHVDIQSAFPITALVVLTGWKCEQIIFEDTPTQKSVDLELPVPRSSWLHVSCFGTHREALTSAVYLQVPGQPLPPDPWTVPSFDRQLDSKLEWVWTKARCETERQRERLAGVILAAKEELARRKGSTETP